MTRVERGLADSMSLEAYTSGLERHPAIQPRARCRGLGGYGTVDLVIERDRSTNHRGGPTALVGSSHRRAPSSIQVGVSR